MFKEIAVGASVLIAGTNEPLAASVERTEKKMKIESPPVILQHPHFANGVPTPSEIRIPVQTQVTSGYAGTGLQWSAR